MNQLIGSRRAFLRKVGGYSLLGYVAGRGLLTEAFAASGSHTLGDNVYTRLGLRPFISANIPFTFLSATLLWPEVRRAAEEASHYFVDIIALQRAVGKRLAEISGAESGMISSGAAGSISLATAACIAGTDPEKIWQLPDTTGLKHEVIMWGGRSHFDSALRLAGGKPIVVRTLEELRAALRDTTAMLYTGYTADPEPVDAPPLAEILKLCHAAGVPVFVDAAGGIPPFENIRRYARMGVDLYGFSGGKGLCGPQNSGLLLGRKDLIEAALANANPVEGAVCRPMKVAREQIIGCLAAVEKWRTVDLDALYREQTLKLQRIAAMVETVSGVKTQIDLRKGSNRFMQLTVHWDEQALGLGVEQCARLLREGDPSISVLSNYNPYVIQIRDFAPKQAATPRVSVPQPLTVFSLGLQPGEELIVGRRLREILKSARG
ncbi:MAG: aminotransferase class V-fold PLP-dependent enzyme [Opitutaceae bacterium]|nr:aminotransferase class V-fold PLP-dependent enzyme [Opitutaceae bacterium]